MMDNLSRGVLRRIAPCASRTGAVTDVKFGPPQVAWLGP
jgi:hypothetical protein